MTKLKEQIWDMMNKLQYAFKVGVKFESDPSGKITYFTAGTDYAVKCN